MVDKADIIFTVEYPFDLEIKETYRSEQYIPNANCRRSHLMERGLVVDGYVMQCQLVSSAFNQRTIYSKHVLKCFGTHRDFTDLFLYKTNISFGRFI